MRKLTISTVFLVLTILVACGSPQGYYDEHGNYIGSRVVEDYPHHLSRYGDDRSIARNTVTIYERPGYYDYNGYYIATDPGLRVPQEMFPPRGMCRVWLPDRDVANQPRVESCEGIRARVPVGAYVIYGG